MSSVKTAIELRADYCAGGEVTRVPTAKKRLERQLFMHEVEALIAKGDELVAQVRQFKNAVVCPLVQGFSLLPITDVFASELAGYQTGTSAVPAKPIESMSDGLHALAITISLSTSVAYISTYYFGGLPGEGQDALVWDKGRLTFSPATQGYDRIWPNTPISQALRMIGVVAENEMDEFDTVDLGKHRKTHRWAESVK